MGRSEKETSDAAEDAYVPTQDDLLMAQCAAGDMQAAREIAQMHGPRVLALAQRMLGGDKAAAEDIVQEALLRVWRHAQDWQPGRAKLGTWIHRVATNLCIDQIRKNRRISGEELPEKADEETVAVIDNMAMKERAEMLHAAIEELPDRQRRALSMRHFSEMSNPDIAQKMEISVEAVESLLARARRALASKLRHQRAKYGLE